MFFNPLDRVPRTGVLIAMFVGILGPEIGLAHADTLKVSSLNDLYRALSRASGGETILLEGGQYGALEIDSALDVEFPSNVTIASADPANPAIFSWADLSGIANLTIDGVVFDYTFEPDHPDHIAPFELESSRNVVIRNSVFDGDVAQGVSAEEDGYGWAKGLAVGDSGNITVENSEFRGFQRGITVGGVTDFVFRGNRVHSMRSDGMNFVVVKNVLVESNQFHDFRRATRTGDHPDMIQFWTTGKDTPSTGITIRWNVFNSGFGDPTQTIFMRNEEVDQGRAGPEMFYRDVLIEENVIVNGHRHGISVGETQGITIRNNTLLRNQNAAQGDDRDNEVRVPRISVAGTSRDVVIENNIAAAFPEPQPGWTVRGNLQVQDMTATRAGYYHVVFREALTGDPRRLESFAYRPEGIAGAPDGPGAKLLRR